MAKKKRTTGISHPAKAPESKAPALRWEFDALSLGLLAGFAIYLAHNAWLKSPDPVIDFGRELYLPWRITEGAVLYKNVGHLYGPLSPYLNSVFFRLAGVGLATLVKANVIIYAAILGLIYFLVRTGWGRWAATVSGALFVGVFSFSHLVGISNYNFLTPYSHEMTQGMLLVLCLVLALWKAIRTMNATPIAASGLLAGAALLMKPEIIFAAAAAVATAAILIILRGFRERPWGRWARAAGIFAVTGIAPVTLAVVLFWLRGGLSLGEALRYSNYAWTAIMELPGLDPFQLAALGLDNPWKNLAIEAVWGCAAAAFAFGLAWGVGIFKRTTTSLKALLCVLLLAVVVAGLWAPWAEAGSALPGILLCGAIIEVVSARKPGTAGAGNDAALRWLLWSAAAAMLARMALDPRIFHYGFVQAALAGVVAGAILVSSVPRLFHLNSGEGKWCQALLALPVLFVVGAVVSESSALYRHHTFQVGEGVNRFYTFDPKVDPRGLVVEQARRFLVKDASENNVRSLFVIPEGVMLNYFTKLPVPTPYYFLPPFVLADGREEEILEKFREEPPDRIVFLSRDMREYGVQRFGDSPEHGQKLVDYITKNYQTIYSFGGDPFNPDQLGLIILAPKPKAD